MLDRAREIAVLEGPKLMTKVGLNGFPLFFKRIFLRDEYYCDKKHATMIFSVHSFPSPLKILECVNCVEEVVTRVR